MDNVLTFEEIESVEGQQTHRPHSFSCRPMSKRNAAECMEENSCSYVADLGAPRSDLGVWSTRSLNADALGRDHINSPCALIADHVCVEHSGRRGGYLSMDNPSQAQTPFSAFCFFGAIRGVLELWL